MLDAAAQPEHAVLNLGRRGITVAPEAADAIELGAQPCFSASRS